MSRLNNDFLHPRRLLLAAFACSLLACGDAKERAQELADQAREKLEPTKPVIEAPDPCKLLEAPKLHACAERRRIVAYDPALKNSPCKNIPGWKGSELGLTLGPDEGLEYPRAYCVFERTDPDVEWTGGDDWVGDCPVVAPWKAKEEGEVPNVGRRPAKSDPPKWLVFLGSLYAKSLDEPQLDGLEGKGNVRVAVIDTAGPNTYLGLNDHGPAMASIIREVGLVQQGIEVMTYAGLPRNVDDDGLWVKNSNADHSGSLGYASDVAVALKQALDDWQPTNKLDRLIINFSLAWPQLGAAKGPTYTLLEEASRRGALILAASGNRSPKYCADEGLFAPAAWEVESSLGPSSGGSCYRPLVHAISPVDGSGVSLINSPEQTYTRLAAPAMQAVVQAPAWALDPDRYYGPMTGSSVASATVAGVAALVWHLAPELEPADLMQRLWETGTEIQDGSMAALYFPSTPPKRQIVSRCNAVRATHQPAAGIQCGSATPPSLIITTVRQFLNRVSKATPHLCKGCVGGTNTLFINDASAKDSTLYDLAAHPQPGRPICPPCYIDTAKLDNDGGITDEASMNLKFAKSQFDNPDDTVIGVYITIKSAMGKETHYYSMDELNDPSTGNSPLGSALVEIPDAGLNYVGDGSATGGAAGSSLGATLPTSAHIELVLKPVTGPTGATEPNYSLDWPLAVN